MATNPYAVDFGQLPFGGMAAAGNMFQGLGGSPQQAAAALGPAYNASYQGMLGMNVGLGGTINNLYNTTMANQLGTQQNIQQGYGDLASGVQNTIQGIDASQRQSIADAYAQQSGAMGQNMVSRGLGNFTVADAAQRGLSLDKQKADINLSNQTAQLQAGYQSQLGLAGLSQQNAANMQNTALSNQQANWLNTIMAQYPNAGLYGQLAQQYGAAGQSAANRQQAGDQFSQMLAASKQGVPSTGGGGGVNPGYINRSPSGLSGAGPSGGPGIPTMMPYGAAGVGASAYNPPMPAYATQAASDPLAYGGGGDWGGNTVSPGQEKPYADFGTGDTGGFFNTMGNLVAGGVDPNAEDPYANSYY